MDRDKAKGPERERLWDNLPKLRPMIEALAAGRFAGTAVERQVIQVLALVISAELKFRELDDNGLCSSAEPAKSCCMTPLHSTVPKGQEPVAKKARARADVLYGITMQE
jgi:hypothetical protein